MVDKTVLNYADLQTDLQFGASGFAAISLWLSGFGALLVISLTGIFFYLPQIEKMSFGVRFLLVFYFCVLCLDLILVALTKFFVFGS